MVTTYFLNLIAGNIFGSKKDPAIPQTYWLGLSSTAPSVDGTGATEPSDVGTAYARIQLTGISEPTAGEVTNSETLSFPESTADWGNMLYYLVYDSQTGGNLCLYDELENSRRVETNTVVTFKPQTLKFHVSNDPHTDVGG